ncbi:kinase-like domain-containing protein [Xylaria sp. FL0933]|nr:kinase-like domain-containing protein [Xylaria sp. FL0933]
MDSYEPVSLPYTAPALPAELPTTEEVLSSTQRLKRPMDSLGIGKAVWVVRVGTHFLAKYGPFVRETEGQTMLFVKKNTNIPIPEVYALYKFQHEGETYTMIIMEFVEGVRLDSYLKKAGRRQLDMTSAHLKAQVDELRSIPAPNYYGSVGRKPLYHCRDAREYGPYNTITEYIDGYLEIVTVNRKLCDIYADIVKDFTSILCRTATNAKHAHPVFTHGDLHELNVIVRPDGTPVIIDYEQAGFFPAYQEYAVGCELDRYFECLSDKCLLEVAVLNRFDVQVAKRMMEVQASQGREKIDAANNLG